MLLIQAREEIKRLHNGRQRNTECQEISIVKNSLNAVREIDNTVEIEELTIKYEMLRKKSKSRDEKFELESKVREIEASRNQIYC